MTDISFDEFCKKNMMPPSVRTLFLAYVMEKRKDKAPTAHTWKEEDLDEDMVGFIMEAGRPKKGAFWRTVGNVVGILTYNLGMIIVGLSILPMDQKIRNKVIDSTLKNFLSMKIAKESLATVMMKANKDYKAGDVVEQMVNEAEARATGRKDQQQ